MASIKGDMSDSSKELFIKTLKRENTQKLVAAPHWWGLYKYEAAGLDYPQDAYKPGDDLYQVYDRFYQMFAPDWFHLHIGTPRYFKDCLIEKRGEKVFLRVDSSLRNLKENDRYFSVSSANDEEIVDFPDYLLGSRAKKPKVDLSSQSSIDDYLKRYVHMDPGTIIEMGYCDHIKRIANLYGQEVFIAVHIPSAICEIFDPTTGYLGFEKGLMAFYDYPRNMKYFLEKCYEEQLNWPKSFAKAGAHGYIISESYISPDLANPKIYQDFMKDVHADYFLEIQRMGLYPMCMFWGDINPILEDLTEINIDGLLIEESKKGFHLEVKEIREKIGDRVALFGNLDSITLLREGNADAIKKETARQAEDAKGNFFISNGSPITLHTPKENVAALIESAREM